jgi:hypothetical protein
MANRDITARDLSEQTGLNYSYVRALICGALVSKKGRLKIERALGLPIWSDLEALTKKEQDNGTT